MTNMKTMNRNIWANRQHNMYETMDNIRMFIAGSHYVPSLTPSIKQHMNESAWEFMCDEMDWGVDGSDYDDVDDETTSDYIDGISDYYELGWHYHNAMCAEDVSQTEIAEHDEQYQNLFWDWFAAFEAEYAEEHYEQKTMDLFMSTHENNMYV